MFDFRDDYDKEIDAEHAALVAEHADIVFTSSKPVKVDRMCEVVPLSSYGDDVNCKYR